MNNNTDFMVTNGAIAWFKKEVFDMAKRPSSINSWYATLKLFKGAKSLYFELFWPRIGIPLNPRKPENSSVLYTDRKTANR